jgi:hypothetical protein
MTLTKMTHMFDLGMLTLESGLLGRDETHQVPVARVLENLKINKFFILFFKLDVDIATKCRQL